MEKCFLKCFILYLFLSSYSVFSQIGVNTTNPHASAALDITSSTKGLLIPRIDSAARVGMTGMANSLLVFDTTKQLFFYYQAANNTWYALNAWQSSIIENGGNTDTLTTTFSKVGIGTNTPTKKLEVVGDIKVSDSVYVGTSVKAGSSISAPKMYGEGTMPPGAIIMWSGNPATLPVGWALCDGTNGTPDLRGRFIVGYNPADPDYNTTQKVGPVFTDADGTSNGTNTTDAKQVRATGDQSGVAAHTHTITQTPHSHSFNDIFQGDKTVGKNSGGGENAASDAETTTGNNTNGSNADITINASTASNANQSIENRPPYYVLAYIIKLAY